MFLRNFSYKVLVSSKKHFILPKLETIFCKLSLRIQEKIR